VRHFADGSTQRNVAFEADQFQSGTWQSSVTQQQNTFRHIYIVAYGTSIEAHSAPTLLGPWTETAGYGDCDLPSGDPKAFCAGPVVHPDLADPTRPDELPVTYAIGSTNNSSTGSVHDFWPHLVRLR
jgi:hypothetical protein